MKRIDQSQRLLTGGGIETYLLFIQNLELREFCGFELYMQPEELRRAEEAFLRPTADAALESGCDLLVDAMTWRAQTDYLRALGYDDALLETINQDAVRWVRGFIERWRSSNPGAQETTLFVSGDVGPRGDGYRVEGEIPIEAALAYHKRQIDALASAGADVIAALTMTNVNESIAIVRAARESGLPCIVSPTVETDGRTPEGISLGSFIERVDAATEAAPLFYMVNCAHPSHLDATLRSAKQRKEGWLDRFEGLRANASCKSHEELDNSTEIDRGDPAALASELVGLSKEYGLRLLGGCCGTDSEHIRAIAERLCGEGAFPDQRPESRLDRSIEGRVR